jgi:hypothetical protein
MTRPTGEQPIDWDRLEALYAETKDLSESLARRA